MSNQEVQETAESAVLPSETPVGQQLRQAREARGLDIAEIAQTLKLGARQVEALESGDWQGLPGHTFVRGFVRNYARLVQVDPAPLMAQLDRALEKPADILHVAETRPASMPQTGGRISRRDKLVIVVGAGLVAVAGLAYVLMPGSLSALRGSVQTLLDSFSSKPQEPVQKPAQEVVPEAAPAAAPATPANEPVFPPGSTPQQVMYPQVLAPAEAPAAKPDSSQGPESPPAAPAAKSLAANAPVANAPVAAAPATNAPQLRFVVDKTSWIEVRDRNNKVVISQRMAAGAEQTVSGQGPFTLTIGNAPGVRLFWHGQTVDLAPHTKGDVARLVLE